MHKYKYGKYAKKSSELMKQIGGYRCELCSAGPADMLHRMAKIFQI
jgi:hypothetical protein